MSTATAAEVPVPAKGKKKLILILAVAALVLAIGGGAAAFLIKRGADAELADAEGEDGAPIQAPTKRHLAATPVFVPLDPFTVNLADRNADRYAQIGITLEVDDNATSEQIKVYMPAIRNNILMAIADRTADDLLAREGKAQLAERVRGETARALGYVVEALEVPGAGATSPAAPEARRRKAAEQVLPVKAVHFSNFIVQ